MSTVGPIEPKKRRVATQQSNRLPRRAEDLEEGEHPDDYDSMLDQYRQEKEDEWVRRRNHDRPGPSEDRARELDTSSPPPSKEIFFQK